MSFTVDQWSQGCMPMKLKCIEYTTKESLLLLRDLSELWGKNLKANDHSIKNVYIDELDEIIKKHKSMSIVLRIMAKINFKVGDHFRTPKYKIFLQKATLETCLKTSLWSRQ